MQTILLEDICNYSIVKKELLDTYNNKFELKEDILYFMNDFCPSFSNNKIERYVKVLIYM
jgi:hypothetical protein